MPKYVSIIIVQVSRTSHTLLSVNPFRKHTLRTLGAAIFYTGKEKLKQLQITSERLLGVKNGLRKEDHVTDRSSTRVQFKEDGCGKGCSLRRTEGKMNDGAGVGG